MSGSNCCYITFKTPLIDLENCKTLTEISQKYANTKYTYNFKCSIIQAVWSSLQFPYYKQLQHQIGVIYWPASHFRSACFLALSCRFPSRFHSFFLLKAAIPGHMEPIPLSCVGRSRRRACGRGWVSVWSCSATVSPGSLLFVDVWSRAAYCRPDVGAHLQLTWEDSDTGPSVSAGETAACYPIQHKSVIMCLFKRTLYGCWPDFRRMHVLKYKYSFLCVSGIRMSNSRRRTPRRQRKSVESGGVSPGCTLAVSPGMFQHSPPHGSASPQRPGFPTLCSNFSTTTVPEPPCLHNEFSQSDYSCTILLSVIIRRELKLKTFVSYYFNSAISMSPRWPSPLSFIMKLIV